ncbi:MAG: FAD-dependent oxidoreductase [Acidobacteriota bacterium]
MKKSHGVVIVGGGVIGASIAFHLVRRGFTDVIVLDRSLDDDGGSTARATGGFRAQFVTPVNVKLSLRARERLLRFEEETGIDSGYRQCGYLFVAASDESLEKLRSVQSVQHGAGLSEARMIDEKEARRIQPALGSIPIKGAAFCPTDGFIRPLNILRGYRAAAEARGAKFLRGRTVTGFGIGGKRIESVITDDGEFAAGTVVNAAGPWAGALASAAGVFLPVTPLRRQVALSNPTVVLPESMPMTIFIEDGFHLRMRDGRALLLRPDTPTSPDPFHASVDDRWIEDVLELGRKRIPALEKVTIDRPRCWAGLYEMTPDEHAVVGPSLEIENFFLANGSSGHGVMHAPAIGEAAAEMILDGHSTLDLSALQPGRFREGNLNLSTSIL